MKKISLLVVLLLVVASGNLYAKSKRPPKMKQAVEVTDVQQAEESAIETEQKAVIAEEEASQAEEKVEMTKEDVKKAEEEAELAEKEKVKQERIADANKKYEESVKNAEEQYSENLKNAEEKASMAKQNAEEDFVRQSDLANSKYDRAVPKSESIVDDGKKAKALEKAESLKVKSIDKAETKKVKAIEKAEDIRLKEIETAEASRANALETAEKIRDMEIDAAEKGKSLKKVEEEEKKLAKKEEGYASGWHKGGYIYGMGGLAQVDHDKNIRTDRTFGGKWNWGFGLTAGYDFVDWLGFMFQAQYSTKSAEVGKLTPDPDYPIENGKEHVATIRPSARFSLTQITNWVKFPNYFVVVPYVKVGGVAHALYIHADAPGNKTAAWGGGMAFGGGLELIFWKKLVIGVDISEDLVWLQSYSANVAGVQTKIIDGGLRKMFNVMGMLGVHF